MYFTLAAAILCGIALGLTPLLVLFANQYAFSAASVRGSRAVLIVMLVAGAMLGLAIPLWRLNRLRVIRRAEAKFPGAEILTIDGLRAEYEDGFGLIRASNTTPVLVLRFEGHTQAALNRIQHDFMAALKKVKPDAHVGAAAH